MRKTELKSSIIPLEIGEILDFSPINNANTSEWLLLSDNRVITHFDADKLTWKCVASLKLIAETDHNSWRDLQLRERLHVSDCGRFAAVVNDYGKRGQVIDIHKGAVTLELNGGDYYPETVPFSFAFMTIEGQVRCIHRTEWNRLDISDPATGSLLSERSPTQYKDRESRPEHYLDYFHGALYLSPNSKLILTDGWVWHPLGIPTIWSIENWRLSNVWESEDGSSKQDVCARDDWGRAICWIDDKRIAIGGIGELEETMIDGARIFDVTQPGVASPNWGSNGRLEIASIKEAAGIFLSDGISLFSSDTDGLSRWSLKHGEKTGHIAGFSPTKHHRGAGEFAQMINGSIIRSCVHELSIGSQY
jgi:hypothetical protein